MSVTTEPRSGLVYGWDSGSSGWGEALNADLLRLGRFGFHLSVKDRDLTAPPSSPAAGDSYVVGASATGAWAVKDDQVAVWDGSAWAFGVPRIGWMAYIEDEDVLVVYKLSGWSAGVSAG